MAGVYIPNMQIPKSCDYCHVWDCPYDQCIEGYTMHNRPRCCPLLFVQNHGNLIDTSKLPWYLKDTKEILEAPVIIPADEDDKEDQNDQNS